MTARLRGVQVRRLAAPAGSIARGRPEELPDAASTQAASGIGGILDRVPVLISYTDAAGRLLHANQALLLALGRNLDTPMGVPAQQVIGEDLYARARPHIDRVLQGERTTFQDSTLVDGRPRHIELTFVPDVGAEGRVLGYVGVGYDLTDRVQRETEVASREQQLSSILNTMAEGLVIHDREGRLIEANPAAERLLSLTRAQLLGWDAAHPHWKALGENGLPLAAWELPVMRVLRTGVPERDQIVGIQIADSPVRWISVNAQPLFNGRDRSPSGVVGTFADVTVLRESLERVRGLAQRLEDVREQERRELAMLLHEGLAQDIFSARLAVGSLLRGVAGEGRDELARLSAILDRCLVQTRQVASSLCPTGPADRSLGDVFAEHARYFEGVSGLRIQVHAGVGSAVSDEATRLLLFRAMQEALTNAARHARASRVDIHLDVSTRQVELRVADDGIGLSPEALEKAGSLGLLGIRERARTIGGSFAVESNAAGGTTLVLRVPFSQPTSIV